MMPNLPSRADVLIVGAGPTGLSLAIALLQQGIAPLVVEKRTNCASTSRAAVIHARTLEMLEALDVTPALLAAGVRVPHFRIRDRDRVLLNIDFAGLATPYPFTLMCPQNLTEAILQDRLLALGGRVMRGVELVELENSEASATVALRSEGRGATLEARWVVGCDGGHSSVRRLSGIAFAGEEYEQDFALADVRMDWLLPRDEVNLFFCPAGLMVVAPLPDDRFRIVATVHQAPKHPDADLITSLLDERAAARGARIRDILWSSGFRVAHRLAEQVVKTRTILCGDAAHVHSPAGGQGMNTGIQDAVSLAEPLSDVLKTNRTNPLSKWAADRRAIAREVVNATDRLTRAATVRSRGGRLARNTILSIAGRVPGVTDDIARRLAELDRR